MQLSQSVTVERHEEPGLGVVAARYGSTTRR